MSRAGRRVVSALLVGLCLLPYGTAHAVTELRRERVQATTGFQFPGTTAVVDPVQQEIRLPPGSSVTSAGIIDGRASGYDVVTINGDTVDTYSFDGSAMVKNNTLSLTPATSPLAVAGRQNNTDAVVLSSAQTTYYSFNGSSQAENPFISVAGLTAPVQVATRPNDTSAVVLDGSAIRTYSYTGAEMSYNPTLSVTSGLSNPVAFALRPSTYDVAVVDGTEVKYYSFNGISLAQNPFMSVSGLSDPVAVQVSADGTVFVQQSGGITAFGFDGAQMRTNSYLSIPEAAGAVGMTIVGQQHTVAVRFSEEIRFYQFNGVSMAENPTLRISGLAAAAGGLGGGQYASSAQAVSNLITVTASVDALVIQANEVKPAGTNVTYWVSGDGGNNFEPARLGKGVRITGGNIAGAQWKAILSTADVTKTPLVKPDVVLTQVYRPQVADPMSVVPIDVDGQVKTATPRLQWTFNDPDRADGDLQTAFQVLIYDALTSVLVHDTGKISALPDADAPPPDVVTSPLSAPDFRGYNWYYDVPENALRGGYTFQWYVRTWDSYDLVSPWTAPGAPGSVFEVMALTDLRITDMVMQGGQTKPPMPNRSPPLATMAGTQFDFAVDSLGLVEWVTVTFSDGGFRSTTAAGPIGSVLNTWNGSYFTDPTLPDGTVVSATFTGGRSDGKITTLTRPIVVIGGTVYTEWLVIMGNNTNGKR